MLTWAPNTETDLAGYKAHYGTSPGSYTQTIDVGNVTTYTATGLVTGTYYFAVTAYDTNGAESGSSNEVSKAFGDLTAPVISGILATPSSTTATISWVTDEPSTSLVEYGPTTAYGSSSVIDGTLLTNHLVNLGGLASATTYHFRVKSVDTAGNPAGSADNTFTTSAGADMSPPLISNISASNITATAATITWSTNEAATSEVEFGLTTAYGASSGFSSTVTTSHSKTLSSLLTTTTYHFRVKSVDASGNLAASSDRTFTTSSAPDTTPPIISQLMATSVGSDTAVIQWMTNEASTSLVQYSTDLSYVLLSPLDSTPVTNHSVTLTGLTPATTYNYRTVTSDLAGNRTTSASSTLTTSAPSDTTPPADVQGFSAYANRWEIRLEWTNPTDSDFVGVRIRYRTDRYPTGSNDGLLLGDIPGQPGQSMSTLHPDVVEGVTYYYAASSYDQSGNAQTTVYVTATLSPPSDNTASGPSTGGCGMIKPGSGTPAGPWSTADWFITAAAALFLMRRRWMYPRLWKPRIAVL